MRQGEIVQQHDIRAGLYGLLQFGFAFNLDLYAPAQGLRLAHGLSDRAYGVDVIFLEQDGVVQSHAVIRAAAAGHRVSLRRAQAGQGLARVQQPGFRALEGIRVLADESGRAGQQLQKIEGGALSAQERLRRAGQPADNLAGGKRGAIPNAPVDFHPLVELFEGLVEPGGAAEDGGLPNQHRGLARLIVRQQPRRQVARPQVLVQGPPHHAGEVGGQGGRGVLRLHGAALVRARVMLLTGLVFGIILTETGCSGKA